MIRVCHLISGHDTLDPRVFKKECKSLAANGYDVVILCSDGKPDQNVDGVKIHSVPKMPKNRLDQFLFFCRYYYKEAKKIDADIYHIHEPFLLDVGKKLKRDGKKVIFDSHEDTVNDIKQKEYIPIHLRKAVSYLYEKKQKRIIKNFDALISVTPYVVDKFLKINKASYMVTNYPILVNIDNSNQYLQRQDAICFVGMARNEYNFMMTVDLAHELNIDCILALRGLTDSSKEDLQKHPAYRRLTIYDNINYSDVISKVYMKSTIGLVLCNYTPNVGYKNGSLGITKLFEYMMMGLPVVCTDFVVWKEIVEGGNCGICVDPQNTEQIKSAVSYLINHKEEAKIMGQNARKLTEKKYNWATQEKILLEIYTKISDEIK